MCIDPSKFLSPHFITLFSGLFCRQFVLCLIDLFMIQGPFFVIKVALGVFKITGKKLMESFILENNLGQCPIGSLCEEIELKILLKSINK
jgi:hypothetical protein